MSRIKELLDVENIKYSEEEPLSRHSTWRIGGPADIVAEPSSICQITNLLKLLKEENYTWTVIGGGSNILFSDEGFRGVVIKLGKEFSSCVIDEERVRVLAGTWTPYVAKSCASNGLSGVEHAVGIPGNIGGLIYMNGGSLRQNIGDSLEWVTYIDDNCEIRRFNRDECDFSYRHSIFQGSSNVIVEAQLKLNFDDREIIERRIDEILLERSQKFPLNYPNCGSVFSNSQEIFEKYGPPGKVVEDCGLKGLFFGDAQVSVKHANFIVNRGSASASDVINLVSKVRQSVKDRTGFDIPCEVHYLSSDGKIMPLDIFF